MARIQEIPLKSGATVTMHTRLGWEEAREVSRRARDVVRKIKDEIKQDFAALSLVVTDWTLRDVETDDPLPFTEAGLRRAQLSDVAEILELKDKVLDGQDPNASSASSPAT